MRKNSTTVPAKRAFYRYVPPHSALFKKKDPETPSTACGTGRSVTSRGPRRQAQSKDRFRATCAPKNLSDLIANSESVAELGTLSKKVYQQGTVLYSNATSTDNPINTACIRAVYPSQTARKPSARDRKPNELALKRTQSQISTLPGPCFREQDKEFTPKLRQHHFSQITQLPGYYKIKEHSQFTPNLTLQFSRFTLTSAQKSAAHGELTLRTGPKRDVVPLLITQALPEYSKVGTEFNPLTGGKSRNKKNESLARAETYKQCNQAPQGAQDPVRARNLLMSSLFRLG